MDSAYKEFLERLREERENKDLTQLQMSLSMRMTQSHYSKAELGKRMFTFYEMQGLCETQVDVFYILMGIRASDKYRHLLEPRALYELTFLFRTVCYANSYRIRHTMHQQPIDSTDRMDLEYYLLAGNKKKTLIHSLRQIYNYSQIKMAEILAVDVKKLRDMEKGVTLPDSEMMLKIYQTFQIPYFVMMKDRNLLISELCYRLGILEQFIGNDISEMIENCVNMIT